MIASVSHINSFESNAMTIAQSAINSLLLELMAYKNNTNYNFDQNVARRFYTLLSDLETQKVSNFDQVASLIKIIQESSFYKDFAQGKTPANFLQSISSNINECINTLETLGDCVQSKAAMIAGGSNLSLFLRGAN